MDMDSARGSITVLNRVPFGGNLAGLLDRIPFVHVQTYISEVNSPEHLIPSFDYIPLHSPLVTR